MVEAYKRRMVGNGDRLKVLSQFLLNRGEAHKNLTNEDMRFIKAFMFLKVDMKSFCVLWGLFLIQ